MQTHEWEALLDGTTPGPWRLSASESVVGLSVDEWDDTLRERANIRLAAHAPASVAEVIRLRKAIEAMRDEYRRNAYLDSWLSQFSIAPLEPVFNEMADALTRILEGEA